jgi:hypothetical protein
VTVGTEGIGVIGIPVKLQMATTGEMADFVPAIIENVQECLN